MKKIVLLGATGSIGRQVLDLLKYSYDYQLVGVSLNSKFELLEEYLPYFDSLRVVAIENEDSASRFSDTHLAYEVLTGKDCSIKLLDACPSADVFNALMGNCGLKPTLKAMREERDLMLANKESIVIGSSLMENYRKNSKALLLPVDSEHVALAKALDQLWEEHVPSLKISKAIITASGGALRDKKIEELEHVKPEEVLNHPNWAMGDKITIDCATMVNKAYEILEASYLFSLPLEKMEAKICRTSLIHAKVDYEKNGNEASLFEFSPCDMKISIAYALSKGATELHKTNFDDIRALNESKLSDLDEKRYPLFKLTIEMFKKHGNLGMIYYNAVDAKAISAFLKGEIAYSGIGKALRSAYNCFISSHTLAEENLEEIFEDAERFAEEILRKEKSA